MSALHITNGDCAAATLREFIGDPVIVAADVLHEGPAPEVDDERWYELRAQFLGRDAIRVEEIRRDLASSDRAIDGAARYDEIVLWFEHDLFDQLSLIRTLDRIGRSGGSSAATMLICVDRFPGVERFIGLGQLDARQLSSLVDRKARVTDDQFGLAAHAWTAFRSADPRRLLHVIDDGAAALPFLAAALQRFLAEYPSTRNGLSSTAHLLLEALEAGPLDAGVLFERTQMREDRPFMGDWGFFDVVRHHAGARVPLVHVDAGVGPLDLRGHHVSLTDAGRDVLHARRDAVALNGIDEWRGGVHLLGTNSSPWRWDAARKTLVS